MLALLKLAECFSRKFCNAVIDVDQILMGYAELHSGVETEVRDLCRDKKWVFENFYSRLASHSQQEFILNYLKKAALSSKETVTKPINISWRSYDFDDFLDNLVARSFISPRKIVVVVHQKIRTFHKNLVMNIGSVVYIFSMCRSNTNVRLSNYSNW